MWVNMHVSESYLDENYADQKQRWVNMDMVQSAVVECASGWNPMEPINVCLVYTVRLLWVAPGLPHLNITT